MAAPVVKTTSGRVRGTVDGAVARFLGLPYAAPLDGAGWFLPAAPPRPWDDVRDAGEYGPTVPKPGYTGPTAELLAGEVDAPGAECLNLNVWTPDTAGSAPVFVWIHGGAFRNGSGSIAYYDGTAFARDGVVCVTINYRLGAFGFLDTGDEHTNLGLRDQIAALQWVRENIAAFGGDPARVTVAGESAGGMSVGSLLGSPLAAGLFAQAVLQSGAGHHALSRPVAQRVAAALADKLGIAPTREEFGTVGHGELIAACTALDLEVQAEPDPTVWGELARNVMLLEPVIGDDVLPRLPIDAIADGAGADVAVLVGWNADEGNFFLAPMGLIEVLPEEAVAFALAKYGQPDPGPVAAAYRALEPDARPGELFSRVLTDWFFHVPAVRIAERSASAPSYAYRFDWRSGALDGRLGACHALEIAFVFDTAGGAASTALTGPNPPQALAAAMHAAWVRFVADGDPGWAPYLPERTVRVFDAVDGVVTGGVVEDPGGEHRRLWDGVR